jgi:hypothetical protein
MPLTKKELKMTKSLSSPPSNVEAGGKTNLGMSKFLQAEAGIQSTFYLLRN